MTNKEFRKILEMAISTCEWALEQQNNPKAMANAIILKAQQNNIDEMKKILEKTPQEGVSSLCWVGFGPPPENYELQQTFNFKDLYASPEAIKEIKNWDYDNKQAEKRDIIREEDK
jgi:hypothetical protein